MSRNKGQDNIDALRAYLDSVSALPARDGKVSVVGVAAAAGIDRQVLYRNEKAKALLVAAAAEKGLVAIENRQEDPHSKRENAQARPGAHGCASEVNPPMAKSNTEKAAEIADAAFAWAENIEKSGDTERYLRGGMLNRSLVAKTLGFSRSVWQTNTRLKALAERLDTHWGTALSKPVIIAKVDAFLADLDAQEKLPPNDGHALLLDATLAQAGIAATHYQRHREVRERFSDLASQHGLLLGTQGTVCEPEAQDDARDMVPVARFREVTMRLAQAERKNAELKAENASLRAQMQRNDEVAELIAMGGRIAPT